MTNLMLSTILAAAALTAAAAGIVSSVPDTGPVTVSINGLGGLELVPVSQSVVASGADHLL